VCFVAFAIFTTSLITGIWWINIFTMILGLIFKYHGDNIVFPQYARVHKERKEKLQEMLEKRQEKNCNYLRNKRKK